MRITYVLLRIRIVYISWINKRLLFVDHVDSFVSYINFIIDIKIFNWMHVENVAVNKFIGQYFRVIPLGLLYRL